MIVLEIESKILWNIQIEIKRDIWYPISMKRQAKKREQIQRGNMLKKSKTIKERKERGDNKEQSLHKIIYWSTQKISLRTKEII